MKEIIVGNVVGEPGKKTYGFLEILEHPVGTIERLPIIIAQGKEEGPTVWLTANIHGNEYAGVLVIHKVINNLKLEKMRGTIVAIPCLNPSGSRTKKRIPYYDPKDPNRLFPDGNPNKKESKKELITTKSEYLSTNDLREKEITKKEQKLVTDTKIDESISISSEKTLEITAEKRTKEKVEDPLLCYDDDELYPSIQEIIWQQLFEVIKKTADYLIDLHSAFIHSIPFVFLDRIFYNEQGGEEERKAAEELLLQTEEMGKAFGFTIIRETNPKRYVTKKLHRSTSGAALNNARIPSFTAELGMRYDVDPEVVKAAVVGVNNVLKWAKMIDGEIQKITNIPVINQNQAVRYIAHPRLKKSGIIHLKVKEGDHVKKGDVIAELTDIFGRLLPEGGVVRTDLDGFVFMIKEGILGYPNEALCWIASNDVQPMIEKWPKSSNG